MNQISDQVQGLHWFNFQTNLLSKFNFVFEELEENSSNCHVRYRIYNRDGYIIQTDWKMKPETREHVLTIETIIYSEYQNEKSPRLDFIGGAKGQ